MPGGPDIDHTDSTPLLVAGAGHSASASYTAIRVAPAAAAVPTAAAAAAAHTVPDAVGAPSAPPVIVPIAVAVAPANPPAGDFMGDLANHPWPRVPWTRLGNRRRGPAPPLAHHPTNIMFFHAREARALVSPILVGCCPESAQHVSISWNKYSARLFRDRAHPRHHETTHSTGSATGSRLMDTFVHMPADTAVGFAFRPQAGPSTTPGRAPGTQFVSSDVTLVVGDPLHYGPRPYHGRGSGELSKPLSERTVALSVNGKTAFASRVPAHHYGIITITDCPSTRVNYTRFGLETQVSLEGNPQWAGWRDGHGIVLRGSGQNKNNAPRLVAVRILPRFSDGTAGPPVVVSFEPSHSARPGAVVRVSSRDPHMPSQPGCICCRPARPIQIQFTQATARWDDPDPVGGRGGILRSYGSASKELPWPLKAFFYILGFVIFCFIFVLSLQGKS